MKITVIGYGIQGRAQALNLRDSGHDVTVANRKDRYHAAAIDDGFSVLDIKSSLIGAEVVFLLIPDAVQDKLLQEVVFPNLEKNATLVFAHGYWLTYEASNIPNSIDILMIAPRFPGEQIRETFKMGGGVPAYIDITKDSTGKAQETMATLVDSLGFSKGGTIKLSCKQEAEMDLFIEQFMAPTFFASAETAFQVLIDNGYPSDAACLELYYSGELGAVRTMMGRNGLYKGFQDNASPTCQYGVSSSRKILWGNDMKEKAISQLERIRSGKFAKELSDHKAAAKTLNDFLESPIAKTIKETEKSVDKKIKKFL